MMQYIVLLMIKNIILKYDSENWKVQHYLERGWDIEMEAKQKLPATKGFVDSLINMNKIYLENKI